MQSLADGDRCPRALGGDQGEGGQCRREDEKCGGCLNPRIHCEAGRNSHGEKGLSGSVERSLWGLHREVYAGVLGNPVTSREGISADCDLQRVGLDFDLLRCVRSDESFGLRHAE